jgi:hypothetical protein
LKLYAGYATAGVCPNTQQKIYRQRHPEKCPYYSVLFHHFDRFAGEYDLRFEKHYGKWRAVISRVVQKYLDCGILKNGFARVHCGAGSNRESQERS